MGGRSRVEFALRWSTLTSHAEELDCGSMAEVLAIVLGFLGIVAAWCFARRYYVHHKRDLEARAREQAGDWTR